MNLRPLVSSYYCSIWGGVYLRPRRVWYCVPTHGSGLGTLFVPKVLYGILLRNVSVQIFAKTKKWKRPWRPQSAKSLLPASDTTRILAPSTHGIRVISMKLPSVIFGRLICHDYRGWILPYARTFTIDRASIYHFVMSMPSYTVNRLLQSTTIIVDGIYNIYKSWHVVDRPLLAVENCTMVLSQRQNSTSYAQKI